MTEHTLPGEHTYKGMIMNRELLPNVLDRIPDFQFYCEDVLIQTYPKAGRLHIINHFQKHPSGIPWGHLYMSDIICIKN